jgi:hypothetical protein
MVLRCSAATVPAIRAGREVAGHNESPSLEGLVRGGEGRQSGRGTGRLKNCRAHGTETNGVTITKGEIPRRGSDARAGILNSRRRMAAVR